MEVQEIQNWHIPIRLSALKSMEKQISVKYSDRRAIRLILMEVQGTGTAADCSGGKLVTLFLPQQLRFRICGNRHVGQVQP